MEVANRLGSEGLPHTNQNGHGQRHRNGGEHLTPPADTMDVNIEFDKPRTRARSNSKVYLQNLPAPPSPIIPSKPNKSSNGPTPPSGSALPTISVGKPQSRELYTFILQLSSLNETFDRKTLTIPSAPDILQLGRPNSSQKAPNKDNGYFDSKVISRNQAALYVKKDQIYIKDSNSSNGTFVNGVKITKETPIKENDVIDLGIDIDANQVKQQHHRKIACKVDLVMTVPLGNYESLGAILSNLDQKDQLAKQKKEATPFDAAFFGDVSSDLDDLALGMNHDFLSGIFVNNSIGTSTNLTNSVKILMSQLHQEKMANLKLQSIERFLENYKNELSRGEQTAKIRQLKRELEENRKYADESNLKVGDLEKKIEDLGKKLHDQLSVIKEKDEHISELQSTNFENNETITRDFETQIKSHGDALKLKDNEIENLKREQQTIKKNYESNLKAMEEKMSHDAKDFTKLKEDYERSLREKDLNETKKDMINLTLISVAIMIIGLQILKVF